MELSRATDAGRTSIRIIITDDLSTHIPAINQAIDDTEHRTDIIIELQSIRVGNEINLLNNIPKGPDRVSDIVVGLVIYFCDCDVFIDKYDFPEYFISIYFDDTTRVHNIEAVFVKSNSTPILINQKFSTYPECHNRNLFVIPDVDAEIPEQFLCRHRYALISALSYSTKLTQVFGDAFNEWPHDTRVEYMLEHLTESLYREKIVPVLGRDITDAGNMKW